MIAPRHFRAAGLLALLLVTFLVGCQSYVRVREFGNTAAIARTAEQREMVRVDAALREDPLARIGTCLDTAAEARQRLVADPNDVRALSDYNFATARIIELISEKRLQPWAEPIECPSATGRPWRVSLKIPDRFSGFDPSGFQFLPADRFRIRGKLAGEQTTITGLGAPIVAIGKNPAADRDEHVTGLDEISYGLTALLELRGRDGILSLKDPLQNETAKLNGKTFPLAANFQAPLALALASTDAKKEELISLFKPEEFLGNARITQVEPYDPSKIPVLLIHGLGNSPATWTPVIDFLRHEPQIRRNYQFWLYGYPTGLPYPIAAAILRKQLAEMRARHPDHKDLVVVGHSMGGMIARLLGTDAGMKIWDAAFPAPPEELPFSPDIRELLTDALIFDAQPHISRIVFVSASHRGSDLATATIGRLGARLIGSAFPETRYNQEFAANLRPELKASGKKPRLPNSIELLDPENRFLLFLDTLPLRAGLPFHSIMGDRGRGGSIDRSRPVSNDGIVPYWSSHLPGAQSERFIPSGHWSHLHPLGQVELQRILLNHLQAP